MLVTWTLLSIGCCPPVRTVVIEPPPLPPAPIRLRPRASRDELRAWSRDRRVDLLVGEVLRERVYTDACEAWIGSVATVLPPASQD